MMLTPKWTVIIMSGLMLAGFMAPGYCQYSNLSPLGTPPSLVPSLPQGLSAPQVQAIRPAARVEPIQAPAQIQPIQAQPQPTQANDDEVIFPEASPE